MSDYKFCPTCDTERDIDALESGCCPFCQTFIEDLPPVEPVSAATVPPPREKGSKPGPVAGAKAVETTTKPDVRLAAEEEAFRMAYDAPQATIDPSVERELAHRTLCRRRLMPFIKRFRPKYDAGWVHEDICRRLERFVKAVGRGESPRLLLMMPPRGGKSEIGSRNFPAWVLGQHPEWEIIAGSHTSSLTMSFSRYVRDLMRDPAYTAVFPNTTLDPSSQSVENWNLLQGGGYLAAGVGTGITGRGAHILLLDDLVKDWEAAQSSTIRDNTWQWYNSTAYTRLAPGGGVLGIMCMTGDTPVMLSDGSTLPIAKVAPGTEIATYARGILARTTVAAVKSSGRDSIYKITMKSGRIVRANERHPFLTVASTGEVSWTRLKNLTTAHKIATVKGGGVSGGELSVLPRGARSLPQVADFAQVTMGSKNGRLVIEQLQLDTNHAGTHDSNTGTASQQQITTPCMPSKVGAAPSAGNPLPQGTHLLTGKTSSLSITATTQGKLEGCSATAATQESDTLLMSQWHLPPQSISDFTLDQIVSIEPDGVEEVFDVQVNDTENFIANGCVSHNTWWNEDDWAGKIQQVMDAGDGDIFEIIKYPAINEEGDEYLLPDDSIIQIHPDSPDAVPPGAKMTRPHNTALHPARYTTEMMLRIKRNLIASGEKRVWDALYQQDPLPDEGILFKKENFRFYPTLPALHECHVFQAWDFAITEGKQSDWTVGVTMLQDARDNLYVAEMRRFRSQDSFVISDEILNFAEEWRQDDGTLPTLGFEDGQIWKAVSAVYERRCGERKIYPAHELLQPLTDKLVRASPLRGRMQLGKVWFHPEMPDYKAMYLELTRFPNAKHDDIVDALAWTTRLTFLRNAPRVPEPPKQKSWRDKLNGMYSAQSSTGHMSA